MISVILHMSIAKVFAWISVSIICIGDSYGGACNELLPQTLRSLMFAYLFIACLEEPFAPSIEGSVLVYKRTKQRSFSVTLPVRPVLYVRAGLGSECRVET